MRSRTSFETLAPGVKVRETAERETPARLATSSAVTNDRRNDCWLISFGFRVSCAQAQRIVSPIAHVCKQAVAADFSSLSYSDPDAIPIDEEGRDAASFPTGFLGRGPWNKGLHNVTPLRGN